MDRSAKSSFIKRAVTVVAVVLITGALLLFASRMWSRSQSQSNGILGQIDGRCPAHNTKMLC